MLAGDIFAFFKSNFLLWHKILSYDQTCLSLTSICMHIIHVLQVKGTWTQELLLLWNFCLSSSKRNFLLVTGNVCLQPYFSYCEQVHLLVTGNSLLWQESSSLNKHFYQETTCVSCMIFIFPGRGRFISWISLIFFLFLVTRKFLITFPVPHFKFPGDNVPTSSAKETAWLVDAFLRGCTVIIRPTLLLSFKSHY